MGLCEELALSDQQLTDILLEKTGEKVEAWTGIGAALESSGILFYMKGTLPIILIMYYLYDLINFWKYYLTVIFIFSFGRGFFILLKWVH